LSRAARTPVAPAARRVGAWGGDLLAAVAGLALPFAFSPFFLWPLAPLSVAVLFVVWAHAGTARAAWRGWLYGATGFGAGVSWIVHSFQFSHIALPLAVLLTVGFVAFLALFPAAIGALLVRLTSRVAPAPRLAAVFPAAWVVGEWLRGWFLTGFTWLQLGYSQVDGPLAGLLPLAGVYGTGLALAAIAGALAWLVLRPGVRSAVGLAVLLLVVAGLAALGAREWTAPAGRALRVALVQGNVPQDQKWRPEMRQPTLERYRALTLQHLGKDLIVWPETALPGRRLAMRDYIAGLHDAARAAGSAVIFGVPEFDGEPLRPYNSVLMVGTTTGRYRKRHLVPFGEYLPADRLLRPITRTLGIPVSDFAAGDASQPPLVVAGQRLALFVCYEIAFGSEVIRELPEAALLITVSNDAWFGDSLGPHQHLQMARARALESGRELLRATNTGITVVADARGQVRARLDQFRIGSLEAVVTPRRGSTPYVLAGDWPALALCVLLLAPAALVLLRARRHRQR
jgi:apolipoprotein N-acyltransferase